MALKYGEEFAEFHDLIDMENILLEHAADRGVERGQLLQSRLVDVGGGKRRKFALKVDLVGNPLAAFAQLVDQQDTERNLAFELVGRLHADRTGAPRTPFPVRILVAHSGRIG